jgi:hypothetical protein
MDMTDELKKPYRVAYSKYNKSCPPMTIPNTPIHSPTYEAVPDKPLSFKHFYTFYYLPKFNQYYCRLKSSDKAFVKEKYQRYKNSKKQEHEKWSIQTEYLDEPNEESIWEVDDKTNP